MPQQLTNIGIKQNRNCYLLRKRNLGMKTTFSAGKRGRLLVLVVFSNGVWFVLLWGNELRSLGSFSIESLSLFGVPGVLLLRRHCWSSEEEVELLAAIACQWKWTLSLPGLRLLGFILRFFFFLELGLY